MRTTNYTLGAGLLAVVAIFGGAQPATAESPRDRADARKHISLLASKDKATAQKAARALMGMQERAVPELTRSLGHANQQVRSYCMAVLIKAGAPAIPTLIERLAEKDKTYRSTVAHTLVKLAPASIGPLVETLSSKDELQYGTAAEALVLIGEPAAGPVDAAARKGDPRVHKAAAYILGKLGKPIPPAPAGAQPTPAQPTPAQPTPAQPKPAQPKPTPAQPAKPARPKGPVVRTKPERPTGPKKESIRGEQWRLDEARSALTEDVVKELEAKADAGDAGGARIALYGVWAVVKRDRVVASRRRGGAGAAETLYQRARDACFGSEPVFESDDDEVDLLSHCEAAEVALKVGDYNTARGVLAHAATLFKGGLQVGPETRKRVSALHATYSKDIQTAAARLTPINDLINVSVTRDGRTLEERVHELYRMGEDLRRVRGSSLRSNRQGAELLKQITSLYLWLEDDVKKCREQLDALAPVATDPEFIDRAYGNLVAQDPKNQGAWDALLGGVRAAVYWERLLAALGLPDRIAGVYLDYVDSCLKRAEQHQLNDQGKAAEGELQQAQVSIDRAKELSADASVVEPRVARLGEVKGSAGAGKLKRASDFLKKAEASLGSESGAEIERASTNVSTAFAWVVQAKQQGIPQAQLAPVEARLAELKKKVPLAYGRVAGIELTAAEEHLQKAVASLDDGARAWRALPELDTAEKRAEKSKLFADAADAASQAALLARADAVTQRVAALRGDVTAKQRMPKDVYTGSKGSSWRSEFKSLLERERGWKVLGLSITDPEWKDKTASYEYAGGGNTKIVETRWYRHLFVWAALEDPENPEQAQLRYLGFRLHKMTDGSYRKLKLYWVDEPVPMLRKNVE